MTSTRLHVLLIEDNPGDARLMKEALADARGGRIDLESVGTLQAGLDRVDAGGVDAILLDLDLPDSTGIDTFTRTYASSPGIPIIVLTGNDDEDLAEKTVREGAQDYLFKGVPDGNLLGRSIRYAIGRKRIEEELDSYRGHLEKLVTQRTLELTVANEKLQEENAERRRTEEALRASEERFRKAVDNFPCIVSIYDAKRRYQFMNAFGQRMTGIPGNMFIGRTDGEIFSPGVTGPYLSALQSALDTGEPQTVASEIDWDSGRAAMIFTFIPLPDADGGIREILGIAHDVTERTRLEEQLRQFHKMEAVGRLAGGIAHDFNNLMMVVTGYAGLVKGRLDNRSYALKGLEEIEKAGDLAAGLTRRLLAFGRKQMLLPSVVDLNGVVSGIISRLRSLLPAEIELESRLDKGLGKINVDPGQIEQVILDLARNAADAMPGGGRFTIATENADLQVPPSNDFEAFQPGAYAVLTLSDTGIGMDEETLSHLFEPFFTTKDVGEGPGLGLATVYGVIRQSSGHITVSSEPEKGTVIRIYLPRIPEGKSAVELPVSRREASPAQKTILVVEDEPTVRAIVRDILHRDGYLVREASDGLDALGHFADIDAPIHLLLTDVMMPRMGGRELAERVAVMRPETRILYMSGYTEDVMDHADASEEHRAFLQKPFQKEALLGKVRELLGSN